MLPDAAGAKSVSSAGNSSAAALARTAAAGVQTGDSTNVRALSGGAAQQQGPQRTDIFAAPAQQADSFAAPPAQVDGSGQPMSDSTMTRTAAIVANAPADTTTQSAPNNAAKTTSGDLANLGLSPGNAAAAQAVTITPGAPPATAVPVAGLPVAIVARAQAGSNQFEIRLDPPELGRIDVRLDVDSDGRVTSHVTVDRPETLSLLQSQQPQLERALEQAGLKTTDNGLQFTLRDQSFAGQNPGGGAPQQGAAQFVIPDPDLPPVDTTQIYSRISLGGGVDIRV